MHKGGYAPFGGVGQYATNTPPACRRMDTVGFVVRRIGTMKAFVLLLVLLVSPASGQQPQSPSGQGQPEQPGQGAQVDEGQEGPASSQGGAPGQGQGSPQQQPGTSQGEAPPQDYEGHPPQDYEGPAPQGQGPGGGAGQGPVGPQQPPPPPPRACFPAAQRAVLGNFFQETSGNLWFNSTGWNGSDVSNCSSRQYLDYSLPGGPRAVTLPDYCCWYGVVCCPYWNPETLCYPGDVCDCDMPGTVRGLDLHGNGLYGTFPLVPLAMLQCEGSFKEVNLGHNNLGDLLGCSKLIVLDSRGSTWGGALAFPPGLASLQIINFQFNLLRGPIPSYITNAPSVTSFTAKGNGLLSLLGNISLFGLTVLVVGQREFVDKDLWHSAPGSVFPLHIVGTSGTLPDNPSSGTMHTGVGPSRVWRWAVVRRLDFRGNFFHCCGRVFNGNSTMANYEFYDKDAPRLPPFLQFSKEFYFYRGAVNALNNDGDFNMNCRSFHAVGTEDTIENQLDWLIDPEYYQYEGCRCEEGYEKVRVYQEAVIFEGIGFFLGNVPVFG
eukprot:gene14057-19996_t